jgi:hypothetical protein
MQSYSYIQTHLQTWITLKSPEALWRIASSQGWLSEEEELGPPEDLEEYRLEVLGHNAEILVQEMKRGRGRSHYAL